MMFKRFTFFALDGTLCHVYASRADFTAQHVVFKDPDGEIIIAVRADQVEKLRPERNGDGTLVTYTQAEALEASLREQEFPETHP